MQSLEDRFWTHVDVGGDDECWPWLAFRSRDGYGRISNESGMRPRILNAHRAAWLLMMGPIPDGLSVLHHCDNPPCVNPSHLFVGTNRDNQRDASAKGRSRGQRQTHCVNGHLFNERNTYWPPNEFAKRVCRACNREAQRRRYLREKR